MANLNDSADIFANSSTETVAENMDFSSFLKQNEIRVKNCHYNVRFPNKDFIHMNQPLSQSSPLGITSPTFSNGSMNVSFITNQFVTDACNASILLFCPFCPEEYKSEFLLKEHIKISHPHELKHIIRMQNEGVEFHACHFCHAKYYLKELLPKHIVKKHQECVLSMFPDVNPDKYAYCPFCSHKVLTRHSKLMIVHIEKKHFVEFQQAIHLKCKNTVLNSDDLKTLDYDRRNESGCSSISRKMRALTTSSISLNEMPIKSILKKTTSYPDGLNESCGLNERQLSTFSLNNSSAMIRRSARRRLRFELPESSSDSENKENSIFSSSKKQNFSNKKGIKLRWRNLFHRNKKNKEEEKKEKKEEKSKKIQTKVTSFSPEKRKPSPKMVGGKKKVQTTPVYSSIGFKGQGVLELVSSQFKCGLCYESFNKNAQLLEHIRRSHKGLKLLPQYLCGHCDAKFYRNTFLVRHCWYHHTPHCLKTETKES